MSKPKEKSKSRSGKNKDRKVQDMQISKRRLWLFRVIAMTVIPAVLLFSAELVLRIANYGTSADAIIKYNINNKEGYSDNVNFGWLFFPKSIARTPPPYSFPVKKSSSNIQI